MERSRRPPHTRLASLLAAASPVSLSLPPPVAWWERHLAHPSGPSKLRTEGPPSEAPVILKTRSRSSELSLLLSDRHSDRSVTQSPPGTSGHQR